LETPKLLDGNTEYKQKESFKVEKKKEKELIPGKNTSDAVEGLGKKSL